MPPTHACRADFRVQSNIQISQICLGGELGKKRLDKVREQRGRTPAILCDMRRSYILLYHSIYRTHWLYKFGPGANNHLMLSLTPSSPPFVNPFPCPPPIWEICMLLCTLKSASDVCVAWILPNTEERCFTPYYIYTQTSKKGKSNY